MPKGIYIHKLSNFNKASLTADCVHCGSSVPVKILNHNGKPKCRQAIRDNKKSSYDPVKAGAYARRHIVRAHGLTQEEAFKLREGSSCFICGTTEKLCVDHDHSTGQIRGILCAIHNSALGMFKDNQEHLTLAITYLQSPPLADTARCKVAPKL